MPGGELVRIPSAKREFGDGSRRGVGARRASHSRLRESCRCSLAPCTKMRGRLKAARVLLHRSPAPILRSGPMTPSQMLTELLAAHSSLRGRVRETRSLSDLAFEGAPVTYQLRGALAVLADALKAHSLREEDLLTDVLPFVDSWGDARAEIMNEGHVEQHRALYDAIAGIPKTPTEFAGA